MKKVFYCEIDKILFHIILLCTLLCCNVFSYGNNASYISLSNQIAKNAELQVVGNNVANANTIGYEADTLLFRNIDVKQSRNRTNSFVYYDRMYKREGAGNLKVTNRNLDLAIGGKGFFKILTPRGPRFTLNGSILVNSEYVLVNNDGMPFANRNNQPITLPVDFQSVDVMQDGTINVTVDNVIDQIDIIGIFDIEDYNRLVKEGNSLYNNKSRDILMDEYTIVSGALRDSNVNSAQSMTDIISLERSSAMATNLLSTLADSEKSLLNKIK